MITAGLIGWAKAICLLRSLWETAASRLAEKDKDSLDFGRQIDFQDLLKTVRDKQKECSQKQWTVPRGSNGSIKVYDVFAKISKWVEKFIKVGDIAVQYDPGHAALPWAAVRFILQISVNDVEKYSVIVEGIETISNVVVRAEIYTALYLRDVSSAEHVVRESMVGLYTSVLGFLAKAARYCTQSTARRIAKSITQFSTGYQELLAKIIQQQEELRDHAALIHADQQGRIEANLTTLSSEETTRHQRLAVILEDLQKPIDRIEEQILVIQDGLQDDERCKILNWLSPQPYIQHHNSAKRDVLEGTGTWLIEEDLLLDWMKSSYSSILWLHGIPGSGKTKLVSILIEHLIRDYNQRRNPPPIYFYCTRNNAEKERSDASAIFASFVRQLCRTEDARSIATPVLEKYRERKEQAFTAVGPILDESVALLKAMIASRPVTTIVIDALDECDETSRSDLMMTFEDIIRHSDKLVKLFVSSREDRDIHDQLKDCPNLEIHAEKNKADITRFVKTEVQDRAVRKKLRSGGPESPLTLTIIRRLTDEAGGMFRWVQMQLQYLCSLKTSQAIKDRLGKLPPKLGDLYEEIYAGKIAQYAEVDKAMAERLFRLLLCGQRRLKVTELCAAILSDQEGEPLTIEELLDLGCYFVVYDRDLDTFRFAHLSVQEYLERKDDYSSMLNHASAAEACLHTLLKSNVDPAIRFIRNIALRNAAREGHDAVVQELLGHGAEINPLPGRFMDVPLSCAVGKGHVSTVKLLLENGAAVNTSDARYGSALQVAAMQGHETIVKLLLENDAAVNAQGGLDGSALQAAAFSGNETTVKLLVDNGAAVNAQGGEFDTALQAAAFVGHETIVKLLLDQGAAVNTQSGYYGSALQAAASRGHETIVKLLLDNGAAINSQGGKFGSALQEAVFQWRTPLITPGHQEILRLLLDRGAAVNTNSGQFVNPLFAAVLEGKEEVTQLLLTHGAEINARDRKGRTALQVAVFKRHSKIIRLLLEQGATRIHEEYHGWTTLSRAGLKVRRLKSDDDDEDSDDDDEDSDENNEDSDDDDEDSDENNEDSDDDDEDSDENNEDSDDDDEDSDDDDEDSDDDDEDSDDDDEDSDDDDEDSDDDDEDSDENNEDTKDILYDSWDEDDYLFPRLPLVISRRLSI
ncbi:MAG: hypothetical protein M1817_001073 [Caeruleum heppii]|nr:MAG: hypothetical protein M1817_001073 [Caeruleum heppii]